MTNQSVAGCPCTVATFISVSAPECDKKVLGMHCYHVYEQIEKTVFPTQTFLLPPEI